MNIFVRLLFVKRFRSNKQQAFHLTKLLTNEIDFSLQQRNFAIISGMKKTPKAICPTIRTVLYFLHCGTDGAVDKRSPPTSVTRVQFPHSPSRVGFKLVVGSCCKRFFSPGSPVFLPPSLQTLTLQICSEPRAAGLSVSTLLRIYPWQIKSLLLLLINR